MSSRGLLYQSNEPQEWSEWSNWKWSVQYSMYTRSRENSEGDLGQVQWQYSTDGRAPNGSGPQPVLSQAPRQVLIEQQPRYAPSGYQILEQSSVPQSQPLDVSFARSRQEYPSSSPISTTSMQPSSGMTNTFVESMNGNTIPPLPRYQPPQVSSSPYFPGSSQNRTSAQNTFGGYSSIARTTISYSTGQRSQAYYQQKQSDNYTSRGLPLGNDPSQRPTVSPPSFKPQVEYYSSSMNIPNFESQQEDYGAQSLAEELNDMSISPSIPASNNWQRNKEYPIEITPHLNDFAPEHEDEDDEFREIQYQPDDRSKAPPIDGNKTPRKISSTKIPVTKSGSKRASQRPSKPSTRSKGPDHKRSSPDDNKRKINKSRDIRSNSGLLDERFRVEPSSKFEAFMVFMVLWSEPCGHTGQVGQSIDSNEDESIITVAKLGENAYHSIRRFVIVVEKQGHSLCLPILTYNGQATLKPGVKQEEHAIIYTGDAPPLPLKGEERIYKRSVRMIGITPRDKLDSKSRINYSKIYTVEHNVKVCFIGYIDPGSEGILITDYRRSVDPPRTERSTGSTMGREKADVKSSGKDWDHRKRGSKG